MYQLVTRNLQGFRNPKALLSFFPQGFRNEFWQGFRIDFGRAFVSLFDRAFASNVDRAFVSLLTGLSCRFLQSSYHVYRAFVSILTGPSCRSYRAIVTGRGCGSRLGGLVNRLPRPHPHPHPIDAAGDGDFAKTTICLERKERKYLFATVNLLVYCF